MSVLTTVGLQQSIRQGWPLILLVYIDHPDGEVRVWTGVGDLSYAGQTWLGVGRLGRAAGIGGARQLRVRQLTLELSGVPVHAAQYLNHNVLNRTVQAWVAGMDNTGSRVNGSAWQIINGRADYQELSVDDSGGCSVQIMVLEPIWSIERAQNLLFTPEWINDRFRDGGSRITGLDLMSTLEARQENWTRT